MPKPGSALREEIDRWSEAVEVVTGEVRLYRALRQDGVPPRDALSIVVGLSER